MIIDKKIKIKVSKKNIEHFKSKNIDCHLKEVIEIEPILLNEGSHLKINVKCEICGNEKKLMFQKYIKNIKNGGVYCCSSKCAQSKVKKTSLEKYGTEYYTQTNEYLKRYKKTSLEKYGTEHHLQNNKIKNKIKNTVIKKYGVDNVSKSPKIIKKIKNTFIEKYGVENISHLTYIKKIISDKVNMKMSDIKKNRLNTLLNKYNIDNVSKLDFVKEKIKLTNLKKIGVTTPLILKKNREKLYKQKVLNWKTSKMYNKDIIDIDTINKKIIGECNNGHKYEINYKTYYNRKISKTIICNTCNPIAKNQSGKEIQLLNFIKENYNKEIITNSKSIIPPYELDIYLPDLRLAFEFNGLYWHNETNKPNEYHNVKTNLCNENGIQLFHIYEDDWDFKQDIIKSMILNKLGKIENRIYARKCEIKEVNNNELIRKFLEKNHIQGFIGSKIKLGLYYNNDLVSLMSFGKLRKPMNLKSSDGEYEMLRFCNKLNTNVVGGASKLFKYFIRNYEPLSVISYADRSYSNGNLYNQLGFELSHISKPNYYYVIDNNKFHRYNFRKDILIKQGFDSSKTEHQIMLERKIYRIYNSGNYVFIYTNKH